MTLNDEITVIDQTISELAGRRTEIITQRECQPTSQSEEAETELTPSPRPSLSITAARWTSRPRAELSGNAVFRELPQPLILRRHLDMIDHENVYMSLCGYQLQPELLLQRIQKGWRQ